MNKLMLVDGNSLLLRAFFATAHSHEPLKQAKDGRYVNGVEVFLKMLLNLFHHYRPTHVAVAWDMGREKTWRRQLYPKYKAQRPDKPKEYEGQQEIATQILDRLGVVNFGLADYEADDILGTLSAIFEKQGDTLSYVVTADGDAMQLLEKRTCVIKPVKGGFHAYTSNRLKQESGIEPWQVPHIKALMGDSSDNIPGVNGIGKKTALGLIQAYGTIEELYHRLDELQEAKEYKRYVKSLKEGREIVFLSKKLATIVRDIPILLPVTIDCFYLQMNPEAVREILNDLNMNALLNRLVS